MARLLEHTAKSLLRSAGVTVPESVVVNDPETAERAFEALGGTCVVKALVPGNRRAQAGAVRIASSADEAARAASDILGTRVGPFTCQAVLLEAWQEIRDELYLAIDIVPGGPAYRLMLSAQGGVDIEENAETVQHHEIDPLHLPDASSLTEYWMAAGVGEYAGDLGLLSRTLLDLFISNDLTLLEVNPLAGLVSGELTCVGALMAVDDNALFRQDTLRDEVVEGSDRAWRPETELEGRVSALSRDTSQRGSARYLELDGGDIGFLCGGGGASLLLFDALVSAGGTPANYSEFGGNPTEQRVYDLTRVVLDKPGVRGLFLAHNLTNNTQVDVIARGVVRALADAAPAQPFPVVAREAGLHDETARQVFRQAGITYFGEETSLDAAAVAMVAAMKAARR